MSPAGVTWHPGDNPFSVGFDSFGSHGVILPGIQELQYLDRIHQGNVVGSEPPLSAFEIQGGIPLYQEISLVHKELGVTGARGINLGGICIEVLQFPGGNSMRETDDISNLLQEMLAAELDRGNDVYLDHACRSLCLTMPYRSPLR